MLNEIVRNIDVGMEFFGILPNAGKSVSEQLNNCYIQLFKYLEKREISKRGIIKQTIFVANKSNPSFFRDKKILLDVSNSFFQNHVPTSIVPQTPLTNALVSVELIILPDLDLSTAEVKKVGNSEYLSVHSQLYDQVVTGGIGSEDNISDIYAQGIFAFEQMQNILKAEKMDFSNVVRQWNYIENIVGFTGKSQNYQIFNDIRSEYYGKSKFDHGYPSATGIGMDAGGIIVDFIAISEKNNTTVIPIKSPVQSDAHKYSKEVLAFNDKVIKSVETTPKFERAKAMIFDNKCLLFISGTAAIKGQISAEKDNAAAQTKLTLENIFHLVTSENLHKHNIIVDKSKAKPTFFRVYVKNASDFSSVKAMCEKIIDNIPAIYVKADICRPELLVEIEGVFTLDI